MSHARNGGKVKALQQGVFYDGPDSKENQHFVYYKDLPLFHKNGGLSIKSSIHRITNQWYTDGSEYEYLRGMADAEQQKEEALLRQYFNTDVHFNLYTDDGVRGMLEAINFNLGLKSVYERNIAIIKAGNQKDSYSWIGAKLMNLLQSDEFFQKIERVLSTNSSNMVAELTTIITDATFQAIDDYLFGMNDSGPNSLKNFEKYRDAYASLRSVMNKSNNEYVERIKQIYQVPQLAETLAKLTPESRNTEIKGILNSRKGVNTVAKQGGLMLEEIVTAELQQAINKSGKLGSSIAVGSRGYRADTIASFGIDLAPLVNQLDQTLAANRAEAARLFENMETNLRNTQSGFIVYTSEKNYTLSNSHGFQAGEAMTLEGYENLITDLGSKTTDQFDTLIGAIVNTSRGAMMEGYTSLVSNRIAKDIGKFLFDDWTIEYGKELVNQESSVQSIHLMNLNGIYVPISVILARLAFAYAQDLTEHEMRKVVSATITTPDLLYYKPGVTLEEEWYKKQYEAEGIIPSEAWRKQAAYTYNNTKIAIHFLKDFAELLRELY